MKKTTLLLMLFSLLISTTSIAQLKKSTREGNTLSGKVTNAINGQAVEGAVVEIDELSATTDAEGNYSIENVPAGSVTANFMATPTNGESPLNVQFTDLSTSTSQLVKCSATDFITYNNNQVNIPEGSNVTLNISLSPTVPEGGMRFVLNWGENPSDLDSHLRTPEIEGNLYHVYYEFPGNETTAPYATTDFDVESGFGPETITIYDFFSGDYHYYVQHYIGLGELSTSEAVVQIYNETGLIHTIQVPTTGTGAFWHIGTIDGTTKEVTIVNTIQTTEPGTGKSNVVYPPKSKSDKNRTLEITSWLWNFGDGNTSTLQNPSHIYEEGGAYSVSLTISDGNNQNILIKENYIEVEGSQVSATLSGKVTNAIDGQAIAGALVEIDELSGITDAEGNYTIENVPAGSLTSNFMGTPTQGLSPLTVQFSDLSTNNTQLVKCSADNFSLYNNNQVIIPDGSSVTLNISLSPIISGSGMRFVLNWGQLPSDLDSYLETPEIEGTVYRVGYSAPGSATAPPYATLDHDVTTGFGPETITIYDFVSGVYYYFIYNLSDTEALTTSEAVVQIYNDNGLIQTLQVPTSGTGQFWYIGNINGNTQTMNLINVIQDTKPGVINNSNFIFPPKPVIETNPKYEVTSWDWSFGDGNTSTLQNPSHTFNTDGMFTVTLVISDGTDTRTETKVDYIKVGNTFSIDEIMADKISLFPNPASDFVEFNSEYVIKQIKLFNNEGKLFIDKNVGEETTKLSLSGLPKGVYLVQISFNNSIITKKLIIQ